MKYFVVLKDNIAPAKVTHDILADYIMTKDGWIIFYRNSKGLTKPHKVSAMFREEDIMAVRAE